MKPIIGVTVNNTLKPAEFVVPEMLGGPWQEWHLVAHDYIRELELAGAIPVMIPIYRDSHEAKQLVEMCDGLVFTGGNNTDPRRFGEKFSSYITSCNPWRDAWELELGQEAMLHSRIPILGICRGLQILNVALGGTLHQNLVADGLDYHASCQTMPLFHPTHTVELTEGSRIRGIMGAERIDTNSFHTMGVKKLGEGLVLTGHTSDGLVEVAEMEDRDRYFLATQFHPEMMSPQYPQFRAIFRDFVEACGEYRTRK